MDHEQKRKLVERYLRAADKFVGYEEQKRRKAQSRAQKSQSKGRAPRQRAWRDGDDGWDDEVGFEKIARRSNDAGARRGPARPIDESLPRATVVAVHRGRIELEDGRDARLAGKLAADPTLQIVVGDRIAYSETDGVARIEGVLPRRSSLVRSDPGVPDRELAIAANVDVGVIVAAAADPPLRPGLIDRYLIALERGDVEPAVCVNKLDLIGTETERAALERALVPYLELDIPVFCCSATSGTGVEELLAHLAGKTCVFVGHSGVGKSSLLNAIDPEGRRDTGDVRAYDGRGRHTTTSSSLRHLGEGTRVIDTPGIRSFGVEHLTPAEIRAGFPELDAFARDCRFEDCSHVHEPDCAVRDALEDGRLPAGRYATYRRVMTES